MNYCDHMESPIGLLEVTASERGITSLYFVERAQETKKSSITDQAITQISEYFDSKRTVFNLPLGAKGTVFQQDVWRELCTIGFGKTRSYQDVANALQNPKAVRAVGAANGRNPISIIVPCHRVIGANGALTGYASGVDRKAWLLKHEGALLF